MTRNEITSGAEWPASSTSSELLSLELVKWHYEEGDQERAEQVAGRLHEALAASPESAHSIRSEEVRSILAELRGDLPTAIHSREAETRRNLEMHASVANTAGWNDVSQLYDHADVSVRLDLLAILYDKQGEHDRARAILLELKQYCEAHRVAFEAQDLLDELEQSGDKSPAVPRNRDRGRTSAKRGIARDRRES